MEENETQPLAHPDSLTVRMLCTDPVSEYRYYINYPEIGFDGTNLPASQVWQKEPSALRRHEGKKKYHVLELWLGEEQCAKVLVDLQANRAANRLVEVQLLERGETTWVENNYQAINYSRSIYYTPRSDRVTISGDVLQNYTHQNHLNQDKKALAKKIYQFVDTHFYKGDVAQPVLSTDDDEGEEPDKEKVERTLNNYLTLNPGLLAELGFSDISLPIEIPYNAVWMKHGRQLAELTKRGCVSRYYFEDGHRYRHEDLDLALKIAVNPLLENLYQSLSKAELDYSSDNKDEAISVYNSQLLHKINTQFDEAKNSTATVINLTGVMFGFMSNVAVPFSPGNVGEGEKRVPIILDHANFAQLTFATKTEGEGCDWSEILLQHASFESSKLLHIKFVNADLTQANFKSADLSHANLTNAKLKSANFKSAKLKEANLTNANLEGANFEAASLKNADLTGAYIGHTNFCDANLTGVKWPLLNYGGDLLLPELDWNKYGAEFILQQLRKIGEDKPPGVTIEDKQARARLLFDAALSKIYESKELLKLVAIIDGKDSDYAYLREETAFLRGSFFGCHGNTDIWHYMIGALKIHLDIVLVQETKPVEKEKPQIDYIKDDDVIDALVENTEHTKLRVESIKPLEDNVERKKVWEDVNQLRAFQKIMNEHRGRWFGDVTHTKFYEHHDDQNGILTILPKSKDMKNLRDQYINQEPDFKQTAEQFYQEARRPKI